MTKVINKLFGGINMTWPKVIIFAIITGVYGGLINQVPFLQNTSFTDIAVTFEAWMLFAVIIAVNSKGPFDSGFKIFVFFLISQPVFFLVETPFLGLDVWTYYQRWFFITLATLPGGIIAYFIKKNNILGALILSVATVLLGLGATDYVLKFVVYEFPRHLLTVIFCLAQIVLYIAVIVKNKKLKALVALITVLAMGGMSVYTLVIESNIASSLPEVANWSCTLEDESNCRVEINGDQFTYYYNYFAKDNTITFADENGEKVVYTISFEDKHIPVIDSDVFH